MPPLKLNRRRFLGCSAAASLAISQGNLAEAAGAEGTAVPVRLGFVGVGNRGTALLRTALELPGALVVAVCDSEPKHRQRGQGIVEKVRGARPDAYEDPAKLFERPDLDGVVVALPCDLHLPVYRAAIACGKHLYAEKPLALSLEGCDRIIAESARNPDVRVHVGFQRRSNPRFQGGIELIHRGELGRLIEARAFWTSSNGPPGGHGGWLGLRDRSGDWMVEQAVHIWDVFHWIKGELPVRAAGWGRRGLFAATDPSRDVTDHYSVELEWADGFRASLVQSWISPAGDASTGSSLRVLGEAGALDFTAGSLLHRDRSRPRLAIQPGSHHDSRLAIEAFLTDIRATVPGAIPVTLADARAATLIGLLARRAVDLGRAVEMDEVRALGDDLRHPSA
jgi:predicted dehydrogenase